MYKSAKSFSTYDGFFANLELYASVSLPGTIDTIVVYWDTVEQNGDMPKIPLTPTNF